MKNTLRVVAGIVIGAATVAAWFAWQVWQIYTGS